MRKIEETTEGRNLTTEELMRKVGERCYGQRTRNDLKREMVAVKWNGIEEAASYLRRKEEAIKRFNPKMPQVEMAEEFVFGAKDLACHTFLERELKREERDDPDHILEKIKGRIMDEGTRRKEDGTKLDDYKMPERKNDVNKIGIDLRKKDDKNERRSPRRSPPRRSPRPHPRRSPRRELNQRWKRPMEEIRRKEEDTKRYGRMQERRQERNDPSVQVRCNNCQGIGHYFWQCASGFQDRRNIKSYGVNNANKYSSRYFLKENEERKEEVFKKKGRRFSEERKNENERKNVASGLTKNRFIQNSSVEEKEKEKEKENKICSVSKLMSNIFSQQVDSESETKRNEEYSILDNCKELEEENKKEEDGRIRKVEEWEEERKFDAYSEWMVGNKEVIALWDTGANKSCISNKLIQELIKENPKLKIENLQIGLRGATGKPIKVNGKVKLATGPQEGKERIEFYFYIVEDLEDELIIGWDLIRRLRGKINSKKNEVKIKMKKEQIKIPLNIDEKQEKFLINKMTVIIEPYTIRRIQIEDRIDGKEIELIKNNLRMVETEEGVIGKDTKSVWITNNTEMKVEVKAGMKIAKLRSVIDVKEQIKIFDKEEEIDGRS